MDRRDELRDHRPGTPIDDEDVRREDRQGPHERHDERREEEAVRPDGVLGIGDANPPRDPVPSDGRGVKGVEVNTDRPGSREVQRGSGATGIDMGAGGEGTDVDRDV